MGGDPIGKFPASEAGACRPKKPPQNLGPPGGGTLPDFSDLPMASRACPVCGSEAATVFAEQRIDPAALDGFAFASRKQPEYMHYRLVVCPVRGLISARPAPVPEALAGAYLAAGFDSSEESKWAARTYRSLLRPVLASLSGSGA